MVEKLWFLIPEMVLFAAAVVVSVTGLSRSKRVRDLSPAIVIAALVAAGGLAWWLYADAQRLGEAGFLMPMLGRSVKTMVCAVGVLLALLSIGLVDRNLESAFATGRAGFDPIRVTRGEFYAFFLLSLTGVMLTSGANDLIWLFLALELTSLPTYVMVATARSGRLSQEAAVKYFFLGAMATAMMLFGFALLYGSTGSIVLTDIREAFLEQAFHGDVNALGLIGIVIALLGVCFKIAAVPMHFYAADVYEGAASPVTAFLAFVPKTAGMVTFIMLVATLGREWHVDGADALPPTIAMAIFMIAVLTMTMGNVLALMQRSVKRVLAYSSVAHTGYMLIGVLAGPTYGYTAVLFYLLVYGVMNTAAFAVLAALERGGEEVNDMADLAGLARRHPLLAGVLCVSSLSLLGFPPLFGFVGKLYLFTAGIEAGQLWLVIIACLNSAASAWYYLKIAGLPILAQPTPQSEAVTPGPSRWPLAAGVIGGAAIVTLWLVSSRLAETMHGAFDVRETVSAAMTQPGEHVSGL